MFNIEPSYLGLIVSGDLDGITIYTDRYGRKTAFPKSPPLTPPTFIQLWQRNRFRLAMQTWTMLSRAERQAYVQCVKRLSLCMTSTSLWCGLSLQENLNLYTTIQRQYGQPLAVPLLV